MRHLSSQSQFRYALFATQDADGYVEALLNLARDQSIARRAAISFRPASVRCERRHVAPRSRPDLH
jgi:hypothetical protein